MLNDFKEFLKRGNVLDLAIGLVIGAAFGKIITTMVDGMLMPVVGMFMGGVDFTTQCINLSGEAITSCADAVKEGKAVMQYGQLIADIVSFIIVAFVVFLIARWAIKLFKGMEAEAGPSAEEELLTEIRDALKK
ncbi:MAG: large conductance mechanosensitive channel protein MscL [Acidobacteriota bacterium]|nr:large conductance mechanosensitive channel protein MscL [Acidobacteriota bacterium]MDH3529510.1 large conductance mechanosensitive channel protein MscL [Acidobacteriota bacterium]